MNEVEIIATGSYVPDRIVTNKELSEFVDTNDEWIRSRTGISERRVSLNENTSDIAAKAAINALKSSNLSAEDIDLIIVATVTPDCYTPSTACIVQEKIGASKATCFDISAACSGFIFGLNIASQFIKTGAAKNALVIGAETLSKILNWNDRNTCVLFGDGAGAAIITKSEKQGIVSFHTGSDGTGGKFLSCTAAPLKVNNEEFNKKLKGSCENSIYEELFLSMEGKEVFKFAVRAMNETIKELLKSNNLTIDDINYVIPHQANLRIIEHVGKKLNIDKDKFYINLHKYGNTSGASIAIALDEANKSNLFKKEDKLILVGFGAGLTWGGTLIKWAI